MSWLSVVIIALWVMLPAYLPNNVAVLTGGGRPIDGGRSWRGYRILGDGKTWRGTIFGILSGVIVALILNQAHSAAQPLLGVSIPVIPAIAVVSLPLGAMLGDMLASFIKRRTGRERGALFPGIDQLDFVVGALVLTAIVTPTWFVTTFTVPVLLAIFVITPLLHVGTNVMGYMIGLKQEPY